MDPRRIRRFLPSLAVAAVLWLLPVSSGLTAAQPLTVAVPESTPADLIHQRLFSEFPNKFGGVYVDDTGDIVVNVAGPTTAPLKAVVASAITQQPRYRPVEVSYLKLLSLQADVSRRLAEFRNVGLDVRIWGPDPESGTLRIGVKEAQPDAQRQAEELLGSPYVTVVNESSAFVHASRGADARPYTGGIFIQDVSGGPSTCTAGFNMGKDGAAYTSTAGHCSVPQGANETFWHNRQFWGTTSFMAYQNGGPTDAQLLRQSDVDGQVYSGYFATQPVKTYNTGYHPGDTVCFSGAFSGEECGVSVNFVNQCISFADGITTCNLNVAQKFGACFTQGGDSGGPVYKYLSAGLSARGMIIGGDEDGCEVGVYSPIFKINETFGALPLGQ